MRKAVAAITAGLLLVAGQAAASGTNSAVVRVGDRIGAKSGQSEELLGIPIAVLLIGGPWPLPDVVLYCERGKRQLSRR